MAEASLTLGRLTRPPRKLVLWSFEVERSKPSPADLARLVRRLVDEKYVLPQTSSRLPNMRYDEGSSLNQHAAKTGCYIAFSWKDGWGFPCPPSESDLTQVSGKDFKIVWPVVSFEPSGLRYPFTAMPEDIDPVDIGYDLEFHSCSHYVYLSSELIGPFESQECAACGCDLYVRTSELETDLADLFIQLHRNCPACGTEFRPEERMAIVSHPRGRDAECLVAGGATYRFAIVIDCGRGWEDGVVPTEAFHSACEEALGCPLEHILDGSF